MLPFCPRDYQNAASNYNASPRAESFPRGVSELMDANGGKAFPWNVPSNEGPTNEFEFRTSHN